MRLTFLGAAGEVTGSCFLIETPQVRFLVDCGMFQGGREADRKNREAFDCGPETIDFVLLTHAHIDHSGLLPCLAMLGFRGPIYTTAATADLLTVMSRTVPIFRKRKPSGRSERVIAITAGAALMPRRFIPSCRRRPACGRSGARITMRKSSRILQCVVFFAMPATFSVRPSSNWG
ncbi:MBL fold metallo-hydrolase [Nitrosospira multiformis]|uniref:Metallo-beta-lactamase superfamily protein n=1 Tax=Nitrosospira multiformis TaxID=1231 RepID=A0A1I7I9L0_9PROT|nr:Metallo-beta-lactamase superfamily protein [Nitrosospira multiformis]